MNSRKIDLSASAAPSAISYIEKLSNMPKVNKKVMFHSSGTYLLMYLYPNHHYIIPTISYHTYRVPIQMLNKKQCFIIQQELKKRGVKQLKFKSPQ